MSRNALPISALLLLACNGVPSRPLSNDYQPQAITVRARFQDVPATATTTALLVHWVDGYTGKTKRVITDGTELPLSDEVHFQMPAARAIDSADYLGGPLRFFKVSAVLGPSYAPDQLTYSNPGLWEEPGLVLVYAMRATFWTPLGPTGPTLNFPAGYSWLRRSCGTAPGEITMVVRPIDEVVDFRHRDGSYEEELDLEASERALVESCGVTTPAPDLGTRVSFDLARSLAWSPDGTTVYYVSIADEKDRTQTAGLRQVRLLDTSTSELTTIAQATDVQVGKPGHLFVSTSDSLLHVTLAPTVTAVPLPNVNGSKAVVSPNGQWLAYGDGRTRVIDLDTGAPVPGFDGPKGNPDRWSNDGRLAYWGEDGDQHSLNTVSFAVPGDVPKSYAVEQGLTKSVVWSSAGVMLTQTLLSPPSWIVQEDTFFVGLFGLTLLDLGTGAERPLLDLSSGMLWPVQRTTLPNKAFTWETKCLGPWLTVCTAKLLRIDAVQATVEPIATWSTSVPVAISSDGRRLALSTSKGIYVKDLPQ
jgi:hypothetical protein